MSELPRLVLDATRVAIEPGGEAVLSLRVGNRAGVVDELRIEVLGDAARWAAVEPASLSLFPGEEGAATVRFRAPRAPTTAPGDLPVGVRAVSTIDGRRATVEECTLEVASFREVVADLRPRSSRGRLTGRHRLLLESRGNTPVAVTLSTREDDGGARVDVRPAQVVLGAGQAASAQVTVRPSRAVLLSGEDTHAFEVHAEPDLAAPVKLAGSMRHSPLVPAAFWPIGLAGIACAAAIVFGSRLLVPGGAGPQPTPTLAVGAPVAVTSPSSTPVPTPTPSAAPSPVAPSPTPTPAPATSVPPAAPTAGPAAACPVIDHAGIAGALTFANYPWVVGGSWSIGGGCGPYQVVVLGGYTQADGTPVGKLWTVMNATLDVTTGQYSDQVPDHGTGSCWVSYRLTVTDHMNHTAQAQTSVIRVCPQ